MTLCSFPFVIIAIGFGAINCVIVGQTLRAEKDELKYAVKLTIMKNKSVQHVCTGTVITEMRILTTLTCVPPEHKKRPLIQVKYFYGNRTDSQVIKVHYVENKARGIVDHICLLKVEPPLLDKSVTWEIGNFFRTNTMDRLVEIFGFSKSYYDQPYESINDLMKMSVVLARMNCPCFDKTSAKFTYCTKKFNMENRCGDFFSDAGGPVVFQGRLEGILHMTYSNELCMPGNISVVPATCKGTAYALMIPICIHKRWLAARIRRSDIRFHSLCLRASSVQSSYAIILSLIAAKIIGNLAN